MIAFVSVCALACVGWGLAIKYARQVDALRATCAANGRLLDALRASHDELQDVALRALRGDLR